MSRADTPDDLFLAFQQAVAGRYFIDRELGRGGMGVVYLAREVQLDRMVAIKLLPPEYAARDDLRTRFLDEARLAARLSHPNIVPIHSVDESGGFVFFVMALVDGQTLAQRVRTRGPVGASDGARMLREVAFALDYAHGQGVVHRDVKPDNILLDRATGRALVADFGIAAVMGGVEGGGATGTPPFMSPEQALGQATDARSDLYSFGVTAYFALCGRLPFEGESAMAIIAHHVNTPPPPLLSQGVAVPRRLATIVDRCLAKAPDERPATALAVAEQLGVAMEQKREVPAVLRAFVKRRGRTSDGLTAVVLVALTMLAVPIGYIAHSPAGAWSLLIGGAALSQLIFLTAAARSLLEMGFDQADLRSAFAAAIEASREEWGAVEQSYRRVGRAFGAIARAAGTFVVLVAPVAAYGWFSGTAQLTALLSAPTLAMFGTTGIFAKLAELSVRRVRDDVDTRFWARLWNGRVGSAVFALAKKLRRGTPVVSAVTHRATELSLGMAAEQLYESLPRATRKSLRDLPALLQRLQGDAQSLRARFTALNEAVTGAGDRAALSAYDAIRAERDEVQGKLRAAVGALETIRLNLLRLHAGQASVESLTSQIAVAEALSSDVRRLIAARESADAMLAPRPAFQTPR